MGLVSTPFEMPRALHFRYMSVQTINIMGSQREENWQLERRGNVSKFRYPEMWLRNAYYDLKLSLN